MKNAAIALLVIALVSMALACTQKPVTKEPEGYRVVSHDTRTGEWVILRNGTFDDKYLIKRITAVCSSYQAGALGERIRVEGLSACKLQVGQKLVPNLFPVAPKDYLAVVEISSDWLAIDTARGPERTIQYLKILKYEVLP